MENNNGTFISASVIKEGFRQTCDISPFALHFIQKQIRERKTNNKYSDVKINTHKSGGERFHEKQFKFLRGELDDRNVSAVTSRLLDLKNESDVVLIEPTLFSDDLHIIGQPDVLLFSENSATVVELKNKKLYEKSVFDRIQIATYMLIFKDYSSKIVENGNMEPISIEERYKKNPLGILLYKDGKAIPSSQRDEDVIKMKATDLLEKIGTYSSIQELALPQRCDTDCVNFNYCSRKRR